jgi:lysophospholipase L1-like esterase
LANRWDLPDPSLYRFDKLHPNKKGYVWWTTVIKPILIAEVGGW